MVFLGTVKGVMEWLRVFLRLRGVVLLLVLMAGKTDHLFCVIAHNFHKCIGSWRTAILQTLLAGLAFASLYDPVCG